MLYERAISVFGMFALVGIAWLLSTQRRMFPWRVVLWGIGLQMIFGVFVLKTAAGMALFSFLNDVMARLLEFTADGSRFLFGDYLDEKFTFALHVLPTIIFFSSLMTVLYHLGVMQRIVDGFSWIMQRTMKTSGAETLSTAANIFLGQTEAPLVVKPYVKTMTVSELHAVMVGGFAGVAGGVLAAYVGMLKAHFPDIAGHLIAASVMSAPATLVIAKVMVPETAQPETVGRVRSSLEKTDANVIDAAARGAGEGLGLAFNVAAMLLAFLALVAVINFIIEWPALWHNSEAARDALRALRRAHVAAPQICSTADSAATWKICADQAIAAGHLQGIASWEPWSLQKVLGYVFYPIAVLMGTPLKDCATVASLLGEKTVLNEFVAYLHMAEGMKTPGYLSERGATIASYALCGFANFGSIAIQIGGISAMAPERRHDLAKLGLRAMFGGMLATCMTATVAGILH